MRDKIPKNGPPKELTFEVCESCGGVIDCSLCDYACKYDGKPEKRPILLCTYKLDRVKKRGK